MPSQQGLWLDEEASPASSRQQSAQSSENCPIRWLQSRTGHLSTQDGNLVAERHDFDGQVLLLTPRQTDQLKDATKAT
jgi:hypothetical protein